MNDKNPIFSENINRTTVHPVSEFLWMSLGAVIIMVTLTAVLFYSMQWVAPYIPFSVEQKLVSSVMPVFSDEVSIEAQQKEIYLQQLSEQLAKAQKLSEGMPITAHWMESEMVNAFATLGGHIFITSALWEEMPSENALAMVVAHEIAHVKHRDPLKSLSAGLTLSLIMRMVFGEGSSGMTLLGNSGLITSLHFTREMETEADKEALETLQKHYGHVAGSTDFFESIMAEDQAGESNEVHLAFLQTHPLTRERIKKLKQIQQRNGWPSNERAVKALP